MQYSILVIRNTRQEEKIMNIMTLEEGFVLSTSKKIHIHIHHLDLRTSIPPSRGLPVSLLVLLDQFFHLLHEAQAELVLPRQSHTLHGHRQPLAARHSLNTNTRASQLSLRWSSVSTCWPTVASLLYASTTIWHRIQEQVFFTWHGASHW